MIRGLSTALGEEIGWRGFLVPELAKQMSYTKLSLLSGFIWAVWHCPLLLFADYNAGTNRWYAMGCFTVMIVSTSFMFAWLRLKSGSLWPAAVLHASHNLFIQTVFDNMMRNTGKTLWYTTEFGAALAVVTTVFASFFWMRRKEVERPRLAGQP
jgi:CAAX protease family protein